MFDITLYNLMKTNYSQFWETIGRKLKSNDYEPRKPKGRSSFGKEYSVKDSDISLTSKIFDSENEYEYESKVLIEYEEGLYS